MATIKRSEAPQPAELAREVVAVAALGGDVLVCELGLEARLEFDEALRKQGGDGKQSNVYAMVPLLLAASVSDADELPLYTVDQWRKFGARNRIQAIELFNVAMRLSGFDGGAEKN